MKYQIVSGNTVREIVEDMGFMTSDGWKPHGSLLCEGGVYRQAVIKEGDV